MTILRERMLADMQLRGLAEDSDFADLVADERYRGVLRLKN